MADIGVVCLEVSGHLNPSTTLARALAARGHRVTLFARPDAEAKARACDLAFEAVGAAAFPRGSIEPTLERLGRLEGWAALLFTLNVLSESARAFLEDGPARLRAAKLDLLLIDEVCPAAEAVADELRLPYVTICNALSLAPDPGLPPPIFGWRYRPGPVARMRNRLVAFLLERSEQLSRGDIRRYRAARGLPTRAGQMRRAMIAQQPALFDFPRAAQPRWFHHAGPFHDPASGDPVDFPFERLDGRPLIFASMGTLQNRQRDVFQAIAEACAGLDVQLLITLGRKTAATSGPESPQALGRSLPGQPLVVAYAPQRALLARAAVVITHAGLNTALETLAAGVPMVALPVTNDQPGVAARLARLGVAEVVTRAAFEPAVLRRAIRRVLVEPSYRRAAQAVRAELARVPGIARAADIVEAALVTPGQVTSVREG